MSTESPTCRFDLVENRAGAAWERFGPRIRDAGLVAVALSAAFAETMARRHGGFASWAPIGAVATAGALAVWWRRRAPITVTGVGLVVVAVTGLPVVMMIGLFSLAVCRRDRAMIAVALAAAAVLSVVWSFDTSDSWARLFATTALVVGFFVAAGAYVGARRDLLVALRERADRAEAEQDAHAERARSAERARIAREMHDVLAHKVSLIAMHAGALEVRSAPTPEHVASGAALIRTTAHEAMHDLREVLGVLRAHATDDSILAPPPRFDDIARLVAASRAAGVHVELRTDITELPDTTARAVHRVVQEGLANVHKHARGAATTVTMTGSQPIGVTVEVANQRPVGATALLPGAGFGLLGLRERVALLGGTVESARRCDGGWRLTVWLPWQP